MNEHRNKFYRSVVPEGTKQPQILPPNNQIKDSRLTSFALEDASTSLLRAKSLHTRHAFES